jgi:hypothetical protein
VRPTLALLGLLLACDAAPAGDPEPAPTNPAPAVDRGIIFSTPTMHVSAVPAAAAPVEAPEQPEPEPEPAQPDLTSPDTLEADLRARLPDHRLACPRIKRLPCKALGDLDGDGANDVVVLVEPAGKRSLGLAILWAHGGVDLLGAGRRGQRWLVQNDETSERETIPADLSTLARWAVWSVDGPADDPRGFIDPRKRRFKAPGVRGAGIMLDGGDSATVAYFDGKGWRLQHLGF